jgi:RimJ/RimL family protein N-acetyltransferase
MHAIGIDPIACELAGVKPRTREVFEARMREVFADPNIFIRVIELSPSPTAAAQFVGSISVFQAPAEGETTPRDNIGYWLAREYWGKGLASEAVRTFLTLEPRRPLFATAAKSNTASCRILAKQGFQLLRTFQGTETDRYLAREVTEWKLG